MGPPPIYTQPHPIHSRTELGSPIPTNHTLAFLPFPPLDAWFTMEKSSIITHYIAARGWGRIYTPYNYNWKPSRSWFGARSKKSPWGDYTSSGHAFTPLLSGMRELPQVSITEIQPVGECMQDISIGLLSHNKILNCAPSVRSGGWENLGGSGALGHRSPW